MLSHFYQRYSRRLLWIVCLSFPFFSLVAESMVSNNDVETWLPKDSPVRVQYEEFKHYFGVEEMVLVGLTGYEEDAPIVEALRGRLSKLPHVRECWSPATLRQVMRELQVSDDEIDRRLTRLVLSEDRDLIGLVVLFNDQGIEHREQAVAEIREEIAYCQLPADRVHLAGAPVVVKELNRLGKRENTKIFFIVTLLVSLCLLYINVRQWNVTLAILGLTVWAINLTLSLVHFGGGEMNFILGALPVMVMVFTLAIAVHLLHYYRCSLHCRQPLIEALRLAWKPCTLATLTTTVGLASLGVSEIGPVQQFGYAASAGAVVALFTGLCLTPAVLTVFPLEYRAEAGSTHRFRTAANWMLDHSRQVTVAAVAVVIASGWGLTGLTSRIDPLEFLPRDSRVLQDVKTVQRGLANTSSIEVIVDLTGSDAPFLEKLEMVREFERKIAAHPSVQHTMSVASFLPERMPDSPLETASLLSKAQARQSDSGFLADTDGLWRITARFSKQQDNDPTLLIQELRALAGDLPVEFTGVAPLLQQAQIAIFNGFWESFAMAFVIITAVMMLSLRSLKFGLVAMVPNLTPICLVFGVLGWWGGNVDIGIMMTGSIALGIAVDGTFHFLVRYQEELRTRKDPSQASRSALLKTGSPIFTAAAVASAGMLALTLSDFVPTAKFGYVMAAMLMAALVGDLVLLPSLLHLRPRLQSLPIRAPHFRRRAGVGRSQRLSASVSVAAGPKRAPRRRKTDLQD